MKLLLKDISGDEVCGQFVEEMGTKYGSSAQFLELEFYGDCTDDASAKQFVEGLKKFEKVSVLYITVNSEGNSSKIFAELNKETVESCALYKTVRKLYFYSVNEINDREHMESFVDKLVNLQKVTGAIEKNFNPFSRNTRRIPKLALVTPDE